MLPAVRTARQRERSGLAGRSRWFTHSQPLAVLFLAIGAGAVFQVGWSIGRMIRTDEARNQAPLVNFAGVAAGMLLLYVTGVLIK